jgi:hypothetical protein
VSAQQHQRCEREIARLRAQLAALRGKQLQLKRRGGRPHISERVAADPTTQRQQVVEYILADGRQHKFKELVTSVLREVPGDREKTTKAIHAWLTRNERFIREGHGWYRLAPSK